MLFSLIIEIFVPETGPLHFFHRVDPNNAGDWFSCPATYFPFRAHKISDIFFPSKEDIPEKDSVVIVGGGGLAKATFRKNLDALFNDRNDLSKVTWGIGFNTTETTGRLLPSNDINLYGDYFSDFDIIGTREFGSPQHGTWVPCASCMHSAFDYFASRPKSSSIGVYSHKNRPLSVDTSRLPSLTNWGNNLVEKLDFLSRYEYILTNTYHGAYWATLLGAKVLCDPFKSSLHSFKHLPIMVNNAITADILNSTKTYPNALSECRVANVKFYHVLVDKFPLL